MDKTKLEEELLRRVKNINKNIFYDSLGIDDQPLTRKNVQGFRAFLRLLIQHASNKEKPKGLEKKIEADIAELKETVKLLSEWLGEDN